MNAFAALNAPTRGGLVASLAALAVALGAGLLVIALSGANPGLALHALLYGAFGTSTNVAATLIKTVPLLLTGLSVALAFRAGLFNIGAEGQLYVGALAAAWLGALPLGLPALLHTPLAVGASVGAGAVWGAVPGWLRARRGVHEVINTIMMNYIAIQTVGYLVTGPLGVGNYATRTADLQPTAVLPTLWDAEPILVSPGILVALSVCAAAWVLLFRTAQGVEIRAVGANPGASAAVGLPTVRIITGTMALAGAAAGLAGGLEICGVHHTLYAQFSPGYGFDGIAVALLARNNPVGVIPAALLFGALRTADRWLQLEAGVPRDIVIIIQAVTILAVAVQSGLGTRAARLFTRRTDEKPVRET